MRARTAMRADRQWAAHRLDLRQNSTDFPQINAALAQQPMVRQAVAIAYGVPESTQPADPVTGCDFYEDRLYDVLQARLPDGMVFSHIGAILCMTLISCDKIKIMLLFLPVSEVKRVGLPAAPRRPWRCISRMVRRGCAAGPSGRTRGIFPVLAGGGAAHQGRNMTRDRGWTPLEGRSHKPSFSQYMGLCEVIGRDGEHRREAAGSLHISGAPWSRMTSLSGRAECGLRGPRWHHEA